MAFLSLADPLQKPAHRSWLEADVDLSRFAGAGAELILETRSFEKGDDPRRAFWGAPALTLPGRAAPLTIVYLVDTLRADHTSTYGYERETTPELTRFAEDAVLFESAVAQAPAPSEKRTARAGFVASTDAVETLIEMALNGTREKTQKPSLFVVVSRTKSSVPASWASVVSSV